MSEQTDNITIVDRPETAVLDVNLLIERLGSCGLSETARVGLIEVYNRIPLTQQVDRFKFLAGVLSLTEAIEAAPVPLHAIPNQIGVDQMKKNLDDAPDTTGYPTVLKDTISESLGIDKYKEDINMQAKRFLTTLLRTDELPSISQGDAEAFANVLVDAYGNVVDNRKNTLHKCKARVMLYVQGETPLTIAAATGASNAAVSQTIFEFKRTLHARGYPPEKLRDMLDIFLTGSDFESHSDSFIARIAIKKIEKSAAIKQDTANEKTIDLPEQSVVTDEDSEILEQTTSISKEGVKLIRELLKDKSYPLEGLTQAQASEFLEAAIKIKENNAPNSGRRTLPVQYDRLRLRLRGLTLAEIGTQTNGTMASVFSGKESFITSLHKLKGGSPAELVMLLQFIAGKKDEGVENQQVSSSQEPSMDIDAANEASMRQPPLAERALNLCMEYWNSEDLISLRALLDNRIEDAEQARFHIRSLLASFAPYRGDGEIMNRLEWDTLNFLTGYHFQNQGQKVLGWKQVGARLRLAYEKAGTSRDDVFLDAFGKLMRRAKREYENGWYPQNKLEADSASSGQASQQPESNSDSSAAPEEHEELTEALTLIAKGSPLDKAQIAQLKMHLGEQVDVPYHAYNFNLALVSFRNMVQDAIIKSNQLTNYGSNQPNTYIEPRERTILSALVGSPTSGVTPLTYVQLYRKLSGNTNPIVAPGELRSILTSALEKIARLQGKVAA